MDGSAKNSNTSRSAPDGWRQEESDRAKDTIKFSPESPNADGYREIISLADGFQLVKSDVEFAGDTTFPVSVDSVLKFQFRLQGEGSLKIDGREDLPMREFSGGVLLQPAGLEKLEYYKAGVHERAVTLLVSPEYLRGKLPAMNEGLPSPLTFYLDSRVDELFSAMLPMTPEDCCRGPGALPAVGKSEFCEYLPGKPGSGIADLLS